MKKCINCRRNDGVPSYASMCKQCFYFIMMRRTVR